MFVKAYAAMPAGKPLNPFEYELGDIGEDQVDIDVSSCGICHSDLSMLDNNWEITEYPIVPGHEIAGTISAVGKGVTHLTPGQKVGLGWFAQSCMTCQQCLSGNHNLCPDAVGTIVGRHGGYADRVRAHKSWVIPLPAGMSTKTAGPLFLRGHNRFQSHRAKQCPPHRPGGCGRHRWIGSHGLEVSESLGM